MTIASSCFNFVPQNRGRHAWLREQFIDVDYSSDPSASQRSLLEKTADELVPDKTENMPAWCNHLCVERQRFVGCAVGRAQENNEYPAILFVPFAVKITPRQITW